MTDTKELDLTMLLLSLVQEYGKEGHIVIRGLDKLAQRVLDEGGSYQISLTALDGETLLLRAVYGEQLRQCEALDALKGPLTCN